jgi:hypothetical protein
MKRLPIGTRNLLYGAHQFALHPLFVTLAWRRLYGAWPREIPIWVAFVVHDGGYWGGRRDGRRGWRDASRTGRTLGLALLRCSL